MDLFDDDRTWSTSSGETSVWIWIVIIIYQFAWILYGATVLFRHSRPFQHPAWWGVFVVNLLFQEVWMWEINELSVRVLAVCLFFLTTCLAITIIVSVWKLQKQSSLLLEPGAKVEIGLLSVLVNNGLGLYTAWMLMATLVTFTRTLHNTFWLAPYACTMVFNCSCVELVLIGCILDNFVFRIHTRYVFTPYLVFVAAFGRTIQQKRDALDFTDIILFGIVLAALIFKVVKVTGRHSAEATDSDT